MKALGTVYRYWVALLVVAVLVQIGAAGYGAFYVAEKLDDEGSSLGHDGFEHGFDFHGGFGYLIFYGTVVLFLLALAARLGRRLVLLSLAAVALVIVQILLAWGGTSTAVVGIFHPLNALLVLGLLGHLAWGSWRTVRAVG